MAEIRDEYGNTVQLTDPDGNPVNLTDEHGNPVRLSGVASTEIPAPAAYGETDTAELGHVPVSVGETTVMSGTVTGVPSEKEIHGEGRGAEEVQERRSGSSSSSSSSEDDGEGGRRKKKGLKEKIKEKLTGGKHDQKAAAGTHQHAPELEPEESTATITTATITTTITEEKMMPPPEREKKSMKEWIKEKLPGHHKH